MKRLIAILAVLTAVLGGKAQRPAFEKMSPMVRQAALEAWSIQRAAGKAAPAVAEKRMLTALVRINGNADSILRQNGCQELAHCGDIYIVSIPLRSLGALSRSRQVAQIQAGSPATVQIDLAAKELGALKVYEGVDLPQAYTGKGVVVGVQDIGFDLTHPTFYSADQSTYRIKALWDQLSVDTIGSPLYVGRDYVGDSELLALQHSRDGLDQTHGTHTTGIAAGSGYDSPYRGIAYESDICVVANATTEDAALIDPADYYKYTYATDALGFKYIFDYADAHGMPCVINFSEGSSMDFQGYDNLYYELLEAITGPGHIIVASAGNTGRETNFFRKTADEEHAGVFVMRGDRQMNMTFKSEEPFTIRVKWYAGDGEQVTRLLPMADVLAAADSTLTDSVGINGKGYVAEVVAYPSPFRADDIIYELLLRASEGENIGVQVPVSVEAVGSGMLVECYMSPNRIYQSPLDPTLNAGISYANVHSPGSAPCVICVGATAYRASIVNYLGETKVNDHGTDGRRTVHSSVGPTYDGRIKPDVMAPGINVISSYSSFYEENHPDARDLESDVAHFEVNGRTYAWNCNSGTSMSSPVVVGAIALWLQANPELTPDDILQVFEKTCTHYDASLTYPNNEYGYGEIDIYGGLVEVLKRQAAGLESVSRTAVRFVNVELNGGRLRIQPAAVQQQNAGWGKIRIFSVAGQLVKQVSVDLSSQTELDLSMLPSGVYAVQIDGNQGLSGSTLIRL